jgi:hypothetical protein
MKRPHENDPQASFKRCKTVVDPKIRICQASMKHSNMLSLELLQMLNDKNLEISGDRKTHFILLVQFLVKNLQLKRVFHYKQNDVFTPNGTLMFRKFIRKHMMNITSSKMNIKQFIALVHDTMYKTYDRLDFVNKSSVFKLFLRNDLPIKTFMINADFNSNGVQSTIYMMLHLLAEIFANCFLIVYKL